MTFEQAAQIVAETAVTTPNTATDLAQDTPHSAIQNKSAGTSTSSLFSDIVRNKRPLRSSGADQPNTETLTTSNNPNKTNQNKPKDSSTNQKEPQKSTFSVENSDMIISLIMAIIAVFSKDMNKAKEMYHLNMIKAAAERLLQIKEMEFFNDETI